MRKQSGELRLIFLRHLVKEIKEEERKNADGEKLEEASEVSYSTKEDLPTVRKSFEERC